jgi:hypothetical protein
MCGGRPSAPAPGAVYSPAVSRGPAAPLTVGDWLRRSAHLWGTAQRLLVFPLTASTFVLLAALPAALVAGEADDFTEYAGYAVSMDERILDGLDGTVSPSTGEWIALAAWYAVVPLVAAWATAAFTRSLVEARLVRVPPLQTFVRIAVLYLAAAAISLPVGLLATADDGALPALVLWTLLTVPLLVADYAIAIDELTIVASIRASLGTIRARPFATLAAFWLLYATLFLVDVLFDQSIADADDVFPPFLLAAALAHGLQRYVVDCSLIALYLGDREL